MTRQTHVSEMTRRVGMSRALLYMHSTKLQEASFVHARLALSEDGKALTLFELNDFSISISISISITPALVAAAAPRRTTN